MAFFFKSHKNSYRVFVILTFVSQIPIKQLYLQPTYNVYQQHDTVETFTWYLTDKIANPIPFHSGWFS